MRRHGHALLLMMTVLAALAMGGLVMASRLEHQGQLHARDAVRTQALWLARSALETGQPGSQTVATPVGAATVKVERKGEVATATAQLPGGTAQVTVTGPLAAPRQWDERYQTR